MLKGLGFAHIGWMFSSERRAAGTNPKRFSPDLLADRDLRAISWAFPIMALFSIFFPPLLGGLVTWSWQGALSAFFWGTLVRMALMHHVTWSTNSIAHRFGDQPFESNDHSTNVKWLAIFTFGESWHNLHHAWPSLARHGVGRGQIDINARLIWLFEKFGWVSSVRWPTPELLERKRAVA
jgi:stearoyl-CoA desaturase (delta-9 desaturase)